MPTTNDRRPAANQNHLAQSASTSTFTLSHPFCFVKVDAIAGRMKVKAARPADRHDVEAIGWGVLGAAPLTAGSTHLASRQARDQRLAAAELPA